MVMNYENRYTIARVVSELKKLVKEDIPQEYKDWASDGITYTDRNPEADVQDYPNNIFAYIRKEPMPKTVRDLVEGILLEGIDDNCAVSATNLGALYYSGMIGEQSYEKARKYYEIAAENGEEQAIENLGYCYYYGRSCEVNFEKAYAYFAKGAFLGRINSLYKIGDMYKNGYYVKQDEQTAYKIYNQCLSVIADKPNEHEEDAADIFVRIADCFVNGIGCEKNAMDALYWAQKAEYEFRKREQNGNQFARSGISWAVNLINQCRSILDQDTYLIQRC